MNSKQYFAFRLIILFTLMAFGESQAQTGWYRSYRDTFPHSVDYYPVGLFEMSDGGLLVPTYRFNHSFPTNTIRYNHITVRTDAAGHLLWMKHDSIPQSPGVGSPGQGGSAPVDAILDRQHGVFEAWRFTPLLPTGDISIGLGQFNSNGSLEAFHYTEGQAGDQQTASIAETADQHIIGAGTTYISGNPITYKPYIFKYDLLGNPVWFKEITGIPVVGWNSNKIITTADGGMLVSGAQATSSGQGIEGPLVAKFDGDGNLLWWQTYPTIPGDFGVDIVQAPDGSFFMITGGFNIGIKLVHLDADGTLLLSTLVGSNVQYSNLGARALAWGGDGKLYFSGTAQDQLGSIYGFVSKVSLDGVILWDRYFANVTSLAELIRLKDGCMAAAGQYFQYVNSSNPPPNGLFLVKICPDGSTFGSKIEGGVYGELDNDCTHAPDDLKLPGASIQIDGINGSFATLSDENGLYNEPVDTGDYTISVFSPSPYWGALCNPSTTLNVPTLTSTVNADFLYTESIACPYMTVDISAFRLRPCVQASYNVVYENLGTLTAFGSYVDLTFDAGLVVNSASVPYTIEPGGIYRFQLGDVEPLQGGRFDVSVTPDCNVVEIGQTLCAQAHIYPDSLCFPNNPLWSGASLEVRATCEGDSVKFTVTNKGAGNMTEPQSFIVIEDTAIQMVEPFQLDHNQTFTKVVAINSATYLRGETQQVPNHPGFSHPSAWVEGCNGFNGVGYVNQFPMNDADNFIETDCHEVTAGVDPNDKTGYPTGIGADRLLAKNTDLEYVIRFQNTGNDTAFTVLVRDTLPVQLDWTTVQPGASSHPYKYNVAGPGIVEFRFDNILLPDSTTNEAASHGYLKFRIHQQPDLADGTLIQNDAAIFFDFNDPVITNTTLHRIGELEAPVVTGTSTISETQQLLRFSPNPMDYISVLQLDNKRATGTYHFVLYDVNGRILRQVAFSGNTLIVKREALVSGVYGFRVEGKDGMVGAGKLIVH